MHHCFHAVGPLAFFMGGLLGSFHCVGMCGPLSVLFVSGRQKPSSLILGMYHLMRMISYALVGFLLGVLGINLGSVLSAKWMALIIVTPLVLYGIGLSLPAPLFLSNLSASILRRFQGHAPFLRAVLTGFFTPLLPCGLLYGALAGALMAPTPVTGSWWMICFAAGTIPLLALSQAGFVVISKKLKTHHLRTFLRILALLAAAAIIGFQWMH